MKKRLTYIDMINVLAIFFVLVIHSSWNLNLNSLGIFDSIIRSICNSAVFLFLMNSGATLINYSQKYSSKVFAKKRFLRVGIPFIFWSIAYYIVDYIVSSPLPDVNYKVDKLGVTNFLKVFLEGKINGTFWFFFVIIGLYFITPILSIISNKNCDYLFYIVILDFLFNFVFIYMNNNLFHINLYTYLVPFSSTTYVGFFIMGYLIKIDYFSQRILKLYKYVFLLMFILTIFISAYKFKISSNLVKNMIDYGGPINFLYTIGLYLYIKKNVNKLKIFKNDKIKQLLAMLSSLSLGIYILHPIFLRIFMKVTNTTFSNWIDILIMPIFTYITCGFVVYVLKKLPFVNKILP